MVINKPDFIFHRVNMFFVRNEASCLFAFSFIWECAT